MVEDWTVASHAAPTATRVTFRVPGSGFRVQFRVSGFGFRVLGFGFWVFSTHRHRRQLSGSGFWVSSSVSGFGSGVAG